MKSNTLLVPKDETLLLKRALSTILDLLVWYVSYVAILLIFFSLKYDLPKSKVKLTVYKMEFDTIIKSKAFILIFLALILLWEIVIPILTDGQSYFKQKMHLKIVGNTNLNLIVRGLIKILILNPYGVIAYVISRAINITSTNMISNTLTLIAFICIILVVIDKRPIHDIIAKTYVTLE
ncbi:RDD family protein [Clostridium felsineum]|uniref:RDD family protein n=1 Tax=Clostridium felsineum TaxID=36839 RepID=UPI00214DBCAC|nr:RDD family protein [Clostridium felsineum]MCR3760001.1 RDD family protein [Clostridium felsineum]